MCDVLGLIPSTEIKKGGGILVIFFVIVSICKYLKVQQSHSLSLLLLSSEALDASVQLPIDLSPQTADELPSMLHSPWQNHTLESFQARSTLNGPSRVIFNQWPSLSSRIYPPRFPTSCKPRVPDLLFEQTTETICCCFLIPLKELFITLFLHKNIRRSQLAIQYAWIPQNKM